MANESFFGKYRFFKSVKDLLSSVNTGFTDVRTDSRTEKTDGTQRTDEATPCDTYISEGIGFRITLLSKSVSSVSVPACVY